MIRAIALAYDTDQDHVVSAFKKTGTLGWRPKSVHCKKKRKHSDIEVSKVYDALFSVANEGGQGSQEKKIGLLAGLLSSMDALSARYLARIPLDKLRLGFSDMTMLDSLSWMVAGDKSLRPVLETTYNVRPDIGYLAQTVKSDGVKGLSHIHAKVGAPILASLCARLPNADEMIKKMGEVAVEQNMMA